MCTPDFLSLSLIRAAHACETPSLWNRFLALFGPENSESPESKALFEQARALEDKGPVSAAVPVYAKAARAGHGAAAKTLGEIYDRGRGDVARDYSKMLFWYDDARKLGAMPPLDCRR